MRGKDLEFGGGLELLVDGAVVVEISRFKDVLVVVVAEDVHHTSSVPVIRHSTAVVDVSRRVQQHLDPQFIANWDSCPIPAKSEAIEYLQVGPTEIRHSIAWTIFVYL